jgi:hypothetical protein
VDHGDGPSSHGQGVAVNLLDGVGEVAVLDPAAVDGHRDVVPVRAVQVRVADVAGDCPRLLGASRPLTRTVRDCQPRGCFVGRRRSLGLGSHSRRFCPSALRSVLGLWPKGRFPFRIHKAILRLFAGNPGGTGGRGGSQVENIQVSPEQVLFGDLRGGGSVPSAGLHVG